MKFRLNEWGHADDPNNAHAVASTVNKRWVYLLSVVLVAVVLLQAPFSDPNEFTVNVKTNRTNRAIPSYLTGAVGDVVTTAQTPVLSQTLSFDVALLLAAFGISYVRLHDTRAMNAADR